MEKKAIPIAKTLQILNSPSWRAAGLRSRALELLDMGVTDLVHEIQYHAVEEHTIALPRLRQTDQVRFGALNPELLCSAAPGRSHKEAPGNMVSVVSTHERQVT